MARILVAVRNPDERGLLEFGLRFAGHQVVIAGNAGEASQQVKKQEPELIVAEDALLADLAYSLRNNKLSGSVPMIVLLELGHEAEHSQAVMLVVDTLVKPISPDALTKKVGQALKALGK